MRMLDIGAMLKSKADWLSNSKAASMLEKFSRTEYSAAYPGSGEHPASAHDGDHSLISLAEMKDFFLRHLRTFALSILIPVALALFYCLTTPPVFTARAQLLIDPQTPQPIQQLSPNGTGFTYDSPQVESQIAVLLSDSIALTVVRDTNLERDPEFGGSETPPADEAAGEVRTQRVIDALKGALDVRREGLSYAINISASSHDPLKAAQIANVVAKAYIKDQLEARANAVRSGSDWLEDRINLIKKQMNDAALKVQEFKVKRDYRIAAPDVVGTRKGAAGSDEPQTSLEELETTASTYRKIYESYLQAYTESVQRQSFPVSNARIITTATPPRVKSKPKTFLILLFAGLVGCLAGLGLALLRDRMPHKK